MGFNSLLKSAVDASRERKECRNFFKLEKFCAIRSSVASTDGLENLIRTLARACLSERECACVYRHARTGMLMGCRDNSLDAPAKFAFSLVADVVQELRPPSTL